ncbi:MAG TPA: hypothetical protein PKE63_08855 [Lacibacter sp.]|nr:hypothetical protein [Lacibacter sp.]HMO87691.1 hypothetical protein [Lacibacter sp.]HMP87371.1 hypothetical protein [Lacibacter sp.]
MLLFFPFIFSFTVKDQGGLSSTPPYNQRPSVFAQLKQRPAVRQWILRKVLKQSAPETQKQVRLLGGLSLGGSLLGTLFMIIGSSSTVTGLGTEQFLNLSGFMIVAAAFVLGIMGLSKYKKLSDKTGTRKTTALIGTLVSGGVLLPILLAAIALSGYGF